MHLAFSADYCVNNNFICVDNGQSLTRTSTSAQFCIIMSKIFYLGAFVELIGALFTILWQSNPHQIDANNRKLIHLSNFIFTKIIIFSLNYYLLHIFNTLKRQN